MEESRGGRGSSHVGPETSPGLRITTTWLEPSEVDELAHAIAEAVGAADGT